MDSSTGEVFFKLINKKKNELQQRIENKKEEFARRNLKVLPPQSVYMIFAESVKSTLPYSVYVGKTKQSIENRYKQHISQIKRMLQGKVDWSVKYRWMYGIIKSGADLRIIKLIDVPRNMVYEVEQEWIYYLGQNGFNVINKTNDSYYSKKVYKV
jgi:hypothetical protein